MRSLNLPVDRTHPHLSTLLSLSQKNLILERIEARIKKRIPVAYLLQEAVFHGDFYYVDANVLIPRSFIGEILRNPDYISQPSSPSSSSSSSSKGKKLIEADKVASILDLCTGSGCLAVLSSRVFVNAATIHAVDNSPACVNIAKKNIESLHLQKKISAYLGDLFSFKEVRQYDLIICNPPYVDAGTLRRLPPEYQHEPSSALGAGKDGLEILHRILTQASQYLTENGVLICEVGRRSGDVYKHYPRLATKLIWLDTELSEGEVFLAKRADLASHIATPDRMAGEMR